MVGTKNDKLYQMIVRMTEQACQRVFNGNKLVISDM